MTIKTILKSCSRAFPKHNGLAANFSLKPDSSNNSKGLVALLPYFRPYKKEIFFALLALLTTTLMVLFFGKSLKYLIDLGFVSKDSFWLNFTLLIFFVAVAVMAIAGYYRSSIVNSVCEKVVCDLRKQIYAHVISVSAEFFEITKAGDVISRLTLDTLNLYNFVSNSISFCLRNLLLFIGGMVFLFITSPKLTLISLTLIIFALVPIILMGRKVKSLSSQSQNALAAVSSRIEESISGIRTIQAYLCEEKEIRSFSAFVENALNSSLEKIRVRSMMVAFVISIAFGSIAVVIWFGSHDILQGKMTSGDLTSFVFYAVISATSLVSLSQIASQFQGASASAARILELLTISSPVLEVSNPENLPAKQPIQISFDSIIFAYPSCKNSPALKEVNFEILPGEKVAIVGQSGSGKSTIFQLLLRFYDVDEGRIKLNGKDIRELSLESLRQCFSYISQDCFIFSGTIFENITYVDKSITESEVLEIIEKNSALHFIKKLPEGMHSFVGEKGIKLSGGERQRIAIARAIIKNSPILLLDEATSALDNENEQSIIRTISQLAEGKTVITIAHRLSSIIAADKVIFIREGKVIDKGSHQDLVERSAVYRQMHDL